jgi:hypothetical protein
VYTDCYIVRYKPRSSKRYTTLFESIHQYEPLSIQIIIEKLQSRERELAYMLCVTDIRDGVVDD